ncbi:hypothetical protein GGX14DRAFT_568873 [Mycena pura]|uniref:Uncharacterized protein n=1 Tax=Mycena pura TaxID=153505 RepID=A0AAD6YCG1_9AGAR|nr:hypothetical protein GGX14DRAFT_568873 [Mycena pura]
MRHGCSVCSYPHQAEQALFKSTAGLSSIATCVRTRILASPRSRDVARYRPLSPTLMRPLLLWFASPVAALARLRSCIPSSCKVRLRAFGVWGTVGANAMAAAVAVAYANNRDRRPCHHRARPSSDLDVIIERLAITNEPAGRTHCALECMRPTHGWMLPTLRVPFSSSTNVWTNCIKYQLYEWLVGAPCCSRCSSTPRLQAVALPAGARLLARRALLFKELWRPAELAMYPLRWVAAHGTGLCRALPFIITTVAQRICERGLPNVFLEHVGELDI